MQAGLPLRSESVQSRAVKPSPQMEEASRGHAKAGGLALEWVPTGGPLRSELPRVAGTITLEHLMRASDAFDLRIEATLEKLADDGAGALPSWRRWCFDLLGGLQRDGGMPSLAAALEAAVALEPRASRSSGTLRPGAGLDGLDGEAFYPRGAHVFTAALGRRFVRRAVLAAPLEPAEVPALARLFELSSSLAEVHRRHLAYLRALEGARVTSGGGSGLLPPSRDRDLRHGEPRLIAARELLDLVREAPEMGWKPHRAWAAWGLVDGPELSCADGLRPGPCYRAHLTGRLAQALGFELDGPAPPPSILETGEDHPPLAIEPFPTYFGRRAMGYRAALAVVEQSFGGAALEARVVGPGGMEEVQLGALLEHASRLFVGAHVRASEMLGRDPWPELAPDAEMELERCELERWARRGTVPTDVRMMVPVRRLREGGYRVRVVLGLSVGRVGGPGVRTYEGFMPVERIVDVDRLLDRERFRALCDTMQSPGRVLAALTRRR